MKIKRKDNVLVITGKDKGKKGIVRHAYPRDNHILVEGINIIKRHTKPRGTTSQAGIISKEAPMLISNVMFICAKCNKPTRIGFRFHEKRGKVRFCKKCNEDID